MDASERDCTVVPAVLVSHRLPFHRLLAHLAVGLPAIRRENACGSACKQGRMELS